MNYQDAATIDELNDFLEQFPDTQMMEVLLVDLNGILRGKRIPKIEFKTFFTSGLKSCASTPLLNTTGDIGEELGLGYADGDPDKIIYPIAGTLSTVPWLKSKPAQVLAGMRELDGSVCNYDPRNILRKALQPLLDMGLNPVVATETEFYLLEPSDSAIPKPLLASVPATSTTTEEST